MDIITNITRVNVALGIFLTLRQTRYGCFPSSGSQGLNLNVLLRTSSTIVTAMTGDVKLKLRKVSASACSGWVWQSCAWQRCQYLVCVLRPGPDP